MTFHQELADLNQRFLALKPELELTVRDPELGVEGYVVVFNTAPGKRGALGPCGKGGTRITPNLSLSEVEMLASRMALKNAGAQLFFGGAKSGIRADPDAPGFEQKYRKFVRMVSPILLENGGIFGGFGFDVGARPEHPRWACDELKTLRCSTGKPLDMGGTDYDREGIAGLGVAVAARVMLETKGRSADEATFSVQGLGAMGAAVVRYFSEYGAELRAVSDLRLGGTVFFDKRVQPELLQSLAAQDFELSKQLIKQEAYEIVSDCNQALFADVLVTFPCATQDVIDRSNVGKIKAKFISEGANNPTSAEAYEILHDSQCSVVPDFIANPGGIIAAYVEMTSRVSPEENLKTKVNVIRGKELTIEKISENVRKMANLVEQYSVKPTEAGRYLALKFMLE